MGGGGRLLVGRVGNAGGAEITAGEDERRNTVIVWGRDKASQVNLQSFICFPVIIAFSLYEGV